MKSFPYLILIFLFIACEGEERRSDAYGNFEADIVTVSAETAGKLLTLSVEEGARLTAGEKVALIDTTALYLQKLQLLANIRSLSSKTLKVEPEIKVLLDRRSNLEREKNRVEELLKNKAATPKQLDDLNGELKVIDQQIAASRQNAKNTNAGILSGADPIRAQIALIEEQISRSQIKNPIDGTVLNKLAEGSEVVGMGSPLYRIASLDPLILHAYASSTDLQNASLGQEVEVLIDEGAEGFRPLKGSLSWISAQAEFTPKTIQTKEERVSLVYALKVRVPNPDGKLKIGMPAEVNFAGLGLSESSDK
ncbi:MAG: HlyD family efflux transporter periplasmic adaptor subunit [Bacteroidia bacterium]|nr:HlyD family efflux transporter periplasmic adaptor subunit [Bacteroidia bacterium]